MSFLTVSAGVGVASGLYGVGKSIAQSSQANKTKTPRPNYQIPDEFIQNAALAKQMAQVGLPQEQYNNQLNAINRNQAAGIQTLNRSGNVGSGIAAVVRASNDANNGLNAADAAARQANQRYAIGLNGQLGQQRLAQQQYNNFDKYTENYNEAAALKGAANQNLQNGVNAIGTVASNLAAYNNSGYGSQGNTQTAPQTRQFAPGYAVGPYNQLNNFTPMGWGTLGTNGVPTMPNDGVGLNYWRGI